MTRLLAALAVVVAVSLAADSASAQNYSSSPFYSGYRIYQNQNPYPMGSFFGGYGGMSYGYPSNYYGSNFYQPNYGGYHSSRHHHGSSIQTIPPGTFYLPPTAGTYRLPSSSPSGTPNVIVLPPGTTVQGF